jgi:hypothetical protein
MPDVIEYSDGWGADAYGERWWGSARTYHQADPQPHTLPNTSPTRIGIRILRPKFRTRDRFQ